MSAKFEVEAYFVNTSYRKDHYLKELEGPQGWILLSEIYNFPKMKKFHSRLTLNAFFEVMHLSADVEMKQEVIDWGDEREQTYYIRKKKRALNRQYANFFGFNVEMIKQLSIKQFKEFLDNKRKFENEILNTSPIIVTTIGKACTKLLRERKFRRVIMDEATMVKEHEAFLGVVHAEQVVLVGDQK
mmetsp:Transcript_16288/g.20629  ORF Transcript_16288/g.20629 Transcript_16288/m.20629 type:complete len:186 (-) Transcript_16288:917-1474(-)